MEFLFICVLFMVATKWNTVNLNVVLFQIIEPFNVRPAIGSENIIYDRKNEKSNINADMYL